MTSAFALTRFVSVCLLCLAAATAHAAVVTFTGAVTNADTGNPIANIAVGATRVSNLGTGSPGQGISAEATVTTNGLGVFTFTVDDATPGLDRVLVFTCAPGYVNELYPGVAFAGLVPTYAEVQLPGVVEIDGAHGASGLDFALQPVASNETTHMVPMIDGTLLATDVYLPAGAGPWPVVLFRTTYGKDSDNVEAWPALNSRGYAVVTQDVRGTYGSEGVFRLFMDDGNGANKDGFDTAQWILEQPWCNGRIGTVGASARGITQNQLAASLPPGVVCQHIGVAASDIYSQAMFMGGAFLKSLAEGWTNDRGAAARAFLDNEVKNHPHSGDPFWDNTSSEERYPLVTWPTVNHGGWYDIFLRGTINNFKRLQHNGRPGSAGKHKLIIDPYGHGIPESSFSWPSGCYNSGLDSQSEIKWIDYWMKGVETGVADDPAVAYYMLGDVTQPDGPGNEWRYAEDWPVPATEVPFYLHAGGTLGAAPPAGAEAPDSYDYDPVNPVPTRGGANLTISKGPYDQAPLESRSDVLVYTSPVLQQPVEITGEVKVVLYASSSAVDTDFTAKLCDVYPDGRSMIVCDGIIRARHRNTQTTDELLTPGHVYEFTIDLWETCIAFSTGHRIRVDISSSNYPRFDANPNTGEPFNQDTHTVVASNTVYHDAARPSRILFRVTGPDEDGNGVPDPADADGDGLPDPFEWLIVTANTGDSILAPADVRGTDDFDGDGISNAGEYAAGTDPVLPTEPQDLSLTKPGLLLLLTSLLVATASWRLACRTRSSTV